MNFSEVTDQLEKCTGLKMEDNVQKAVVLCGLLWLLTVIGQSGEGAAVCLSSVCGWM